MELKLKFKVFFWNFSLIHSFNRFFLKSLVQQPKDSTIFVFQYFWCKKPVVRFCLHFHENLKVLNSQNISYLCGLAFGHFLWSKAVLSSYTEYILPTLLNIFHSPRPTLWLLWVMTFYKFYSVPCVEIANNVSLAGTRHVFELPKHTWAYFISNS